MVRNSVKTETGSKVREFSKEVQAVLRVVTDLTSKSYGGATVRQETAFNLARDVGYIMVRQRAGTLLTEKGEALLLEHGKLDEVFGSSVPEGRFDTTTNSNA